MKIYLLPAWLALVYLLGGCTTAYRTTAEYPAISPLGKTIQQYRPYKEESLPESESAQPYENIQKLTLNKALALALQNNPELASYSLEVRAMEASALQASLRPNPELGVEVEDFAGNEDLGGYDSAEATIFLSQDILLGNKIKKRSLVATLESDLAAWDYESKRLEVFTEVKKAFIAVLAFQEEIKLNNDLLKISEDFLENINSRISAGKVNSAEASRAKFIVSSIGIDIRSAKLALQSAKQNLTTLWGSRYPTFSEAEGTLDSPQAVPPLKKLQALLLQNPALARNQKEVEQRQAALDLEKANALPDINFGVGYRRYNESNNSAFLAAFSIPLPFNDRNQGGIAEAKIRCLKTKREFTALETRLKAELSAVYNNLINLHHEVTTLKKEMRPDAEQAFKTIKSGNMLGRFTILDVLDAQRTLFDVRSQYIRSTTDFQIAKVEIEHLIAQELITIEHK
jgi:cobalt-zinc-cadmium efflux system outer membrane protein